MCIGMGKRSVPRNLAGDARGPKRSNIPPALGTLAWKASRTVGGSQIDSVGNAYTPVFTCWTDLAQDKRALGFP